MNVENVIYILRWGYSFYPIATRRRLAKTWYKWKRIKDTWFTIFDNSLVIIQAHDEHTIMIKITNPQTTLTCTMDMYFHE